MKHKKEQKHKLSSIHKTKPNKLYNETQTSLFDINCKYIRAITSYVTLNKIQKP